MKTRWLLVVIVVFLHFIDIHAQTNYTCDRNSACGCSRNFTVISRIVGGEAAGNNTWGWMVSLQIGSSLCGGSILDSAWVVTAAHCLVGVNPSSVRVYAGSTFRFSGTQTSYAAEIFIHPLYHRATFENDIALIRLQSPFVIDGANISTICLPQVSINLTMTNEWPPVNSSVVAIGWGRLSTYGSLPMSLQQVTVQVVSFQSSACNQLATNVNVQFCAAYPGSGKDTCQGDSGGPLMYFDSNRRWVLAGLTSAGADCASLEYSAIYTRVLTFTDWINSYVNPSLITTTRTPVGITTTITSRPLISNTTVFNHPKYLNYFILMIVNLILQLLF